MDNKPTYAEMERLLTEQAVELGQVITRLALVEKEYARRSKVMEIQRDLSGSLAMTHDLTKGLQLSLEAGLQVSGMDCGGIYLFDPDSGDLDLQVHQGLSAEFVQAVQHFDKESDNAVYVQGGQPVYTNRIDLGVSMSPVERSEGIRAFIYLPLLDGEEVVGCMNLGSRGETEVPLDIRLPIETVAAQIGSAVSLLRARAALWESEGHFRSLMESASEFAIFQLARDEQAPNGLRVVFASDSIKDILGVCAAMDFEAWFAMIHPDDVARVAAANQKSFETLMFDQVFRIFHKLRGEWRWIHAVSTGGQDAASWNNYMHGMVVDVTEMHRAEEALKSKALNLEEMNTALNVLLEKRGQDRTNLEDRFLENIEQMVLPYIAKLEHSLTDLRHRALVDILRRNLSDITSAFPQNLSSKNLGLTRTEIEVATFIKNGKRTKEIAKILGISPKTVKNHRQKIRIKAGLANKKINLRSFLLSLR